jgi:hypothetical protein
MVYCVSLRHEVIGNLSAPEQSSVCFASARQLHRPTVRRMQAHETIAPNGALQPSAKVRADQLHVSRVMSIANSEECDSTNLKSTRRAYKIRLQSNSIAQSPPASNSWATTSLAGLIIAF